MGHVFVTGVTVAALVAALVATEARAVVMTPIPEDVAPAPPPIPSLPAADETPPPEELISDPITAGATCGAWSLQSSYGGSWPAGSTWWEYQCSYEWPQCTGACTTDWAPYVWVDHFYWDGLEPVFYGEFFGDYYYDSFYMGTFCSYWWDEPTARWYRFDTPECLNAPNTPPVASFALSCADLSCTFDGTPSSDSEGAIVAYDWDFGDGVTGTGGIVDHTYPAPGAYQVRLTVTDDKDSTGVSSILLTVTNLAPVASFTFSCADLSCTFDGSASSGHDDTIVAYAWDFGDGEGAIGGSRTQHTYPLAERYEVTLTVTDDAGVSASASNVVSLLALGARSQKVRGLQTVDLSWNGGTDAAFYVYRDGARIAIVQGSRYTDDLGKRGPGTYSYTVCVPAASTCSNTAIVSF